MSDWRRRAWRVVGCLLLCLASCQRTTGVTPSPPTAAPTAAGALPAVTPAPTRPASEGGPSPSAAAAGGLPRETRALWSWVGRTARTPADVDALVAQVDAARLNVILLGIYDDGTAYFEPSPRRFPDPAQRLPNRAPFNDAGYPDALSYLLAIRDQRRADTDATNDFEVHAWFTVHRGGDAENDWPAVDKTEPFMLNALFPEFRLKFGTYYTRNDTRYINPAVAVVQQPRFRRYMADLIAGVVEDYPVDGVHLDYIRTGGLCFNGEALDYPGTEFDYPGCQADYAAWTLENYGRSYTLWDDTDGERRATEAGAARIAAWQVRSMGALVSAIHAAVKAVEPRTIISVASVANAPWNKPDQGQVAWAWLDAGWIDAMFPTLYFDDTQQIVERVEHLRAAVQDERRRQAIFPGLATYEFETRAPWTDLLSERTCALLCANPAGPALAEAARGVALFRSEHLSPAALSALAAQPFQTPAVPYWGEAQAGVAAER